ncbi:MAG: hypothetical protein EOO81_01395 [Oxalobacteraceae bacterium]|nr:MAG: hypothetical protein EOO81_01395 [Oxalobacteraceae bacterium]
MLRKPSWQSYPQRVIAARLDKTIILKRYQRRTNPRENFIDMDIHTLLPGEKEALLEALRRDLRSERSLARHDTGWAAWHQRNVQLDVRLLEAFNPKRREFTKPVCEDFYDKVYGV